MRLLEISEDGSFGLTKVVSIPPHSYAILSHTWSLDEADEVTFEDLERGKGHDKNGYAKLQFCATQAKNDGLKYCWIDTCCINKKDSSELAEAIISMYRWYKSATACYVYLADIPKYVHKDAPDLIRSRWFTRGWTLQELLAPAYVSFFARNGDLLGTKGTLAHSIHQITGVPTAALGHINLANLSVDQRLGWAERRQTKKPEDGIYCLMGLFGVAMPVLYGEGYKSALARLRTEIEKSPESKIIYRTQTISATGGQAVSPTANSVTVTMHRLKSKTQRQVTSFSKTLTLPAETRLDDVVSHFEDGCRGHRVSRDVQYYGSSSPVPSLWEDCNIMMVEVTTGPSCYNADKGCKIHCGQSIADFCSRLFPRPVAATIKADRPLWTKNGAQHDRDTHPKVIEVTQEGADQSAQLSISLMRTVRIPDDGKTYPLPAGLDMFPLFNTRDFAGRMPNKALLEGGIFFPMYQSEAMWLQFLCFNDRSWAVRPFVGGVNGITGEATVGDINTLMRRLARINPLQDYVVLPEQKWLDGIATEPGSVRQFVATPLVRPAVKMLREQYAYETLDNRTTEGRLSQSFTQLKGGLSVEYQITGRDAVAGFQLQIIPMHDLEHFFCGSLPNHIQVDSEWITNERDYSAYPRAYDLLRTPAELGLAAGTCVHVKNLRNRKSRTCTRLCDLLQSMSSTSTSLELQPARVVERRASEVQIFVNTLGDRLLTLDIPSPHISVDELKRMVHDADPMLSPDSQRLIFAGRQLEDGRSLWDHGVEAKSTIHLILRLRGGGSCSVWIYGVREQFYRQRGIWDPLALKTQISQRFHIDLDRITLFRSDGTEVTSLEPSYDDFHLQLSPSDQPNLGLGVGGHIKQDIKEDQHNPRLWDVANARLLNIQILNATDFHGVTGYAPPPTPITAATYAQLGIPFFAVPDEAPALTPSKAFKELKSVSASVTFPADKKGKAKKAAEEPSPLLPYDAALSLQEDNGVNLSGNRIMLLEPDLSFPDFTSAVEGFYELGAMAAETLGLRRRGCVSLIGHRSPGLHCW